MWGLGWILQTERSVDNREDVAVIQLRCLCNRLLVDESGVYLAQICQKYLKQQINMQPINPQAVTYSAQPLCWSG